VAARQCAPGLGALTTAGLDYTRAGKPITPGKWRITTTYRKQHSHRHFVGTVEQKHRAEEGSEVINDIHLVDFALSYQHTPRWSFNVSAPVMIASRTSSRTGAIVHSKGLGDIMISARTWLWRPPTESRQNIAVGFGLKLPTGKPDVQDTRYTTQGNIVSTVDQSIQLGDGGWGVMASADMFKVVKRATLFASGIYLSNPQETNGVLTGRSRPSEAIMSIPDQYLVQAGVTHPVPGTKNFIVSAGGRLEGVPVRDIFGGSLGFRRPGYVLSFDPGVIYVRGRNTLSFNIPIPLERNRTRSTSDIIDGRHGDAAFADYLLILSYSRSF
jgi:hypothetical protein